MAYLLDADAFIRAKNLHYGFEICPGFWDWLVTANERGIVFSIEKVADEVAAGDDDLAIWADCPGDFSVVRRPAFLDNCDGNTKANTLRELLGVAG